MALAVVHSRARLGVRAPEVAVEVHLGGGLPRMSIVGLPEAAVRESKDRVRAAFASTQFDFPARAITVNLAPADLPKQGGAFDLPIALGILVASGQLPARCLQGREFMGELGLTGDLKRIRGVLPAALASAMVKRQLVIPHANAEEAALCETSDIRTAHDLRALVEQLRANVPAEPLRRPINDSDKSHWPDMADVRGQQVARRALEIAAAGEHHVLFAGPPGCGKSMLATRLPGIMPMASDEEALETAAIASLATTDVSTRAWRQRPFRSPHHTASAVALIGGGRDPRPGEVSLAHNGVLFLDEFTEWSRHALQCLREPLESGVVHIARASKQLSYPARFQLIAAMNPCPCGYAGDPSQRCECMPDAIARYRAKVSGPLLDRIDLHVSLARIHASELHGALSQGEGSEAIRERVADARGRQVLRQSVPNARLEGATLTAHCTEGMEDADGFHTASERLRLSARASHRVLRVARTIADLAHAAHIERAHWLEALTFRPQI
ncbi:YifB family Mg chelatase-like AAA ATPase [Lysobacter sp. HDW10]|uniref:YifB family Mg chelatase-like AAA ATPase n=1 Tax=Lysobacter sp. HDW10 TaxID=2714936 RepID=UPI001409DF83|nr:YifB family Mg chelatase-like AAA ATPase [Lysobacter sp. HDW10]QIK80857.1 YifB family Mg chelatase-like AAA ATPase [Lysobacter sp. HDW10]